MNHIFFIAGCVVFAFFIVGLLWLGFALLTAKEYSNDDDIEGKDY
jgi:hypothetical protein